MSFSHAGQNAKVKSTFISTFVSDQAPLISLANSIDWEQLATIALPDLKATTAKGFWHLGRTLYL
jgi:hypothetical protein